MNSKKTTTKRRIEMSIKTWQTGNGRSRVTSKERFFKAMSVIRVVLVMSSGVLAVGVPILFMSYCVDDSEWRAEQEQRSKQEKEYKDLLSLLERTEIVADKIHKVQERIYELDREFTHYSPEYPYVKYEYPGRKSLLEEAVLYQKRFNLLADEYNKKVVLVKWNLALFHDEHPLPQEITPCRVASVEKGY